MSVSHRHLKKEVKRKAKLKNPPLWFWDIIGIGFLVFGILGICKYGISQKGVFYIAYTIIGAGFLVLTLTKILRRNGS